MEAFQEEQQKLIANLLMDRSDDVIKAATESRKRDEERDKRRQEAEEIRRLAMEQKDKRKKF